MARGHGKLEKEARNVSTRISMPDVLGNFQSRVNV